MLLLHFIHQAIKAISGESVVIIFHGKEQLNVYNL